MSDLVEVSVADGIQTIRFNRPDKKNALTSAMYAIIADAMDQAEETGDIRANLFLGLPEIFTAGNDIMDFLAVSQSSGGLNEPVVRFLNALGSTQTPMVAAVDGLAIGIGTTMLLHCDMVYASPRAMFKTPFLDLALLPEAGSSLLGPRLMGQSWAFELLALGEPFDANRAREAGFVNAVVDTDQLEETARATAAKIAAKPPEAMRIARALLRGERQDVLARIREEGDHFGERLTSAEAKEAFMAFMEKRKPDFTKLAS